VTYRSVLRVPEFRGLFVADGLSVVGDQITRLAVALLVFERTGSAFAAAATYAISYLTWLVGGPLLSALPDRYARRRVMIACDLSRMTLVAALAVPGLPLWVFFSVLGLVGLLAPPFDSARSALVADILEGEQYVVGNALSNVVAQVGQVLGFVAGGALVAAVGVNVALLVDAATFGVSTVVLALLVKARPAPAGDREGRTSLLSEAAQGARLVVGNPRLRHLLAWGVLSFCVVVGPEGLAVAVSDARGGGAFAAGVLTAAVPAGFLLGSVVLLRVPADRRERMFPFLLLVTSVPLMLTPLFESLTVIAVLWLVAGSGNAIQLVANAAFVQAVPPHLRGRAFGVAGTAIMAAQGLAVLGAGALAELTGPATAVAAVALLGLLALPVLVRSGRHAASSPQESSPIGRTAT
jgi:MFS family permease